MAGDEGDIGAPAGGGSGGSEGEIDRLRHREAHYRGLLEDAHRRAERSRSFTLALGELSTSDTLSRLGIEAALGEIATASARHLEVERSSVWLYSESGRAIECICLVVGGVVAAARPKPLAASLAPSYFATVASARVIAVSDARSDARTRELTTAYLEPLGVTSMLDAPIRAFGSLVGVLCNEHVGEPRVWTDEERSFVAAIGDLTALAVTAAGRERAEGVAESSAARYRYLVESLPGVVYSFHPKAAELDYVSPQIEALIGIPPENLVGPGRLAHWFERVHPEDTPRVRSRFDMLVGAGTAIERAAASGVDGAAEYRIRGIDGAERWVRDSFRFVRNADGEPLGVQGVIEDITEASVAARERDEQKRTFRDLVAHTDLIALLLDAEGCVTFVNDALLRLFGMNRDELLHRDWFDVMVPADQRDTVRGVVLGGMRADAIERVYENDVLTKSGRRRRIRFSNTVLRDGAGHLVGTASLGVDLTDRLELEARLLEAQKLESLGRLASGIAHDFNNLLTAVRGSVDLVSRALPPESRVERHLDVIRDSTSRAAEMTASLLGFARRRPIDPTTFDIDVMIREALPTLAAATGHDIAIETVLRGGGALVSVDSSGLYQVLLNLVLNARDAAPRGATVSIGSEVVFLDAALGERFLGLPAGSYVTVSIRDEGHGMTDDVARRVFEPFFTTKPEGRGTGLGLATSFGIIRQAGGHLAVASTPGHGSVFTIYLPRVEARDDSLQERGRANAAMTKTRSSVAPARPTVLLVDDDPSVRWVLEEGLREHGFDVVAAGSAREAIDLAEASASDLRVLVTDFRMPDMAGTTLADRIRRTRPTIQTVVLSGAQVSVDASLVAAVLEKPITGTELAEHLYALLDRAEAERSVPS